VCEVRIAQKKRMASQWLRAVGKICGSVGCKRHCQATAARYTPRCPRSPERILPVRPFWSGTAQTHEPKRPQGAADPEKSSSLALISHRPAWPSTWPSEETRHPKAGGRSFEIMPTASRRWICSSFGGKFARFMLWRRIDPGNVPFVHLRAPAAEPMAQCTHDQCDRAIARGVQAADQNSNRAAFGRHCRDDVLGVACLRTNQHAQGRWLADPRHKTHRSAD
jgi:hypothetical protein